MPQRTPADAFEFVMGFIEVSKRYKDQFLDPWQEVLDNFIVVPYDRSRATTATSPYRRGHRGYKSRSGIVLKDPGTHTAVMTYAAKLVKALLGDSNREYIQAQPVGWEDAPNKAPTVTRLLRHAFGIPGHFRTMVEAIVDMLLFGTSILEVTWKYEEREMPVREVSTFEGVENFSEARMRVPVYDDVLLSTVDVQDFFPDPSCYRIQDMSGVAKKFKMTALKARAMARGGVYRKDATERAIASAGKTKTKGEGTVDRFREGRDQPREQHTHADFKEMIGYEYYGDVPWEDDQGSSRRVITILNGEVVRDKPYPYADPALPFHTLIINPLQGRFYGISPAEVIRYDQDFADALKMLLAEAVVRSVHPPIAYDPDGDVDVARIMRWKADVPIAVRGGPKSIGTLQYAANTMNGFNMMAGQQEAMQRASGALGSIEGSEGPDRESATVGAMRYQNAMDRPELAGMVLESECFPPIAKAFLRRYQQFYTEADLKKAVGEMPEPVWLGDIMGDFDVQFVGSRMAMTRQTKLQAYDRLISLASAVPEFRMLVPWLELGPDIIGNVLELPEVAARVGSLETVQANALLSQLATAEGANNGNAAASSSEPSGTLPAQAGGGNAA